MALVSVAEEGGVGTITLNHAEKRNALGEALIGEVVAALDRLRAVAARVVVLRAQPGVKVWSAGHAIDELPQSARDPLGWSDPLRTLVRRLQEHPVPVIAVLEGGVWGGACEVVFACDVIVAALDVTFAITPARLGVPYGVTSLQTLAAVVPLVLLKEMVFTARPVGVERLWQAGAVNHVLPAEALDEFTADMTRTIVGNAPLTIAAMKETLRILHEGDSLGAAQFERLRALRRRVGDSRDYQEGLRAFGQRRAPVFCGE